MARKLEWEFDLKDRMSGPAADIRKELGHLDEALEETEHQEKKTEEGGESFLKGLLEEKAIEKFAELAIEVAKSVLELGHSFIESGIEAASFKEDTVLALSTIMGSAEEAEATLGDVIDLAGHLPIETKAAVAEARGLITAGFGREELKPLITAVADVGVIGGPDASSALLSGLERIKTVGFDERVLKKLSSEAKLGKDEILKNLSKYYGGASSAELEVMLKKHLIDKNEAIEAVLTTVAQKQGGSLGIASAKAADGFEGTMNRIKSKWTEFTFDFEKTPGFQNFLGALHNLADVLDPKSEIGAQVKGNLESLFGDTLTNLVGQFSGPEGAGRMQAAFSEIGKAIAFVHDVAETAITAVKEFGEGFFFALSPTEQLFGPDGHLNPASLKEVVAVFRELGEVLGGITLGIEKIGSAASWIGGVVGSLNPNNYMDEAIAASAKHEAEAAASPLANSQYSEGGMSDELAAGEHVVSTEDLPHMASGGIVDSPTVALIGESGPEAVTPLSKMGRGGGSSVSIPSVAFNVDARGLTNGEEIVAKIRAEAPSLLLDLLEQLAMQQGYQVN